MPGPSRIDRDVPDGLMRQNAHPSADLKFQKQLLSAMKQLYGVSRAHKHHSALTSALTSGPQTAAWIPVNAVPLSHMH